MEYKPSKEVQEAIKNLGDGLKTAIEDYIEPLRMEIELLKARVEALEAKLR